MPVQYSMFAITLGKNDNDDWGDDAEADCDKNEENEDDHSAWI